MIKFESHEKFCYSFWYSLHTIFFKIYAQETEKVLEIKDDRKMTAEEKNLYDSKQHQNHDVEVYRTWVTDGEGYFITFYLVKDDTLKQQNWGIRTDEYYDKLYYHWQDNTVLFRLENSRTKKFQGFRWSWGKFSDLDSP